MTTLPWSLHWHDHVEDTEDTRRHQPRTYYVGATRPSRGLRSRLMTPRPAGGFFVPPFTSERHATPGNGPRDKETTDAVRVRARRHRRRQRAVGGSRPGHGRGRRAVHPLGRRPLPLSRGGLPGRRVRLRRGWTQDVLQMRRRDWTPWEFERACRNLAHRLQAHGPPRRDRPGRGARAEAATR